MIIEHLKHWERLIHLVKKFRMKISTQGNGRLRQEQWTVDISILLVVFFDLNFLHFNFQSGFGSPVGSKVVHSLDGRELWEPMWVLRWLILVVNLTTPQSTKTQATGHTHRDHLDWIVWMGWPTLNLGHTFWWQPHTRKWRKVFGFACLLSLSLASSSIFLLRLISEPVSLDSNLDWRQAVL